MTEHALSRRRLLAGAAAVATLATVAGCTDSSDDQSTAGDGSGATDGSSGGDGTATDGTTDDEEMDESGTDDSGESTNDDTEQAASDDSMTDSTDGETDDSADESGDPLDLQEANVVEVTIEESSGGDNVAVALHHDDDGEDGYANWWQVERLDGTRLGRRDLTHPHSRQPFTRSETIDVPDGVTCVVVRGHDQTHGYGGQAMLVDVDTGATRAVDQGSDQQSFDGSDCP